MKLEDIEAKAERWAAEKMARTALKGGTGAQVMALATGQTPSEVQAAYDQLAGQTLQPKSGAAPNQPGLFPLTDVLPRNMVAKAAADTLEKRENPPSPPETPQSKPGITPNQPGLFPSADVPLRDTGAKVSAKTLEEQEIPSSPPRTPPVSRATGDIKSHGR